MPTAAESALDVSNTRRWPRYQANLPVLISAGGDPIPGLANEISRSGMALYGGVCLEPGDLMKVEFQTSTKLRVAGVVRNRSGFCFGLEFITVLASEEDAANLAEFTLPLPHEQLRDWLAKHRGDVSLAMASAFLLFSLFAWDARPASVAKSQTLSQPSLSVWERALVKLGLAELPQEPAALIGNPAVQVWIDQHTALYYCPGAELYGKTPDGRFTSQRDAQMDQFEPAARSYCQ